MHRASVVIEWLVGLAALAPAVRLAADRGLRRQASWLSAALAAAVASALAAGVALAWWRPDGLHAVAAAAALAAAGCAWWARPGAGVRRGLPAGSLGLGDSLRAIVDRDFYARRFARHGPIFKMSQFDRKTVCVLGLARGQRLFREHEADIGPAGQALSADIAGGFLRYMRPDTYAVYGNRIRAALAGPAIAAAGPATAGAVRAEIADWAARSARANGAGVAPGPHLERIAFTAFVRAIFGVEPGDPRFARFRSLYAGLFAHPLSRRLGPRVRRDVDSLRELVAEQSALLRARPAGSRPECALGELVASGPDQPDAVCVDNLIFVVKIAVPNLTGLMHWILKWLGDHPEWTERLRKELEAPTAADAPTPDLTDRIIMESLRLSQSEYRYRAVEREFRFDGFVFPRGWLIRQCVAESHRDPSVFEEPDRFDPDRFVGRRYGAGEYSPFGQQLHACNGVPLVQLCCRALLAQLARHARWRIARDGPAERRLRHWSHWQPSSRLRIDLALRSD